MKYAEVSDKVVLQLVLIAVVCFLVYSPTLFSEFCRIDDLQMVESLQKTSVFSLRDVFVPGNSGGLYYRPLLLFSFIADRFVFGLSSFAMHLHNIIIHLLNVVLLFFLSKKLLEIEKQEYPYLPLVVALLFLVHPITTESINWVSGRTDLLASTFVLASAYLLFIYIDTQRRVLFYGALLLFIGAILSKEFALAFLPGFILLATYRRSSKFGVRAYLAIIFLAIVATSSFFVLRSLAFSSNATQISMTLLVLFNTPERALQLALTAVGFYFKKLFIPVPLNFAIYEVNALYEFVAWPVLLLIAYLFWKRTLAAILFITGVLLVSPALLIVFNQIAWTPFAERYLYLSAAFVTLATTYCLRRHVEFPNNVSRYIVVMLVFVFFCWSTVQRNITWMTAYGIVADTVSKSPESTDMQFVFASILIELKEFSRARDIIAKIKTPPGIFYDERGDLLEAELLLNEGKRDQAIRQFEITVKNSKYKSVKSINRLIELYKENLIGADAKQQAEIKKSIYSVRQKHYKATCNVALLSDLSKDALNVGDTEKAERYLMLFKQNIPSQK